MIDVEPTAQAIDAAADRMSLASANERRVVCAAIRNRYGAIICGPRHYDATMRAAILENHDPGDSQGWNFAEQGFVDQRGGFMSREEARKVAMDAGQIIRRCGGDETELFSENIY